MQNLLSNNKKYCTSSQHATNLIYSHSYFVRKFCLYKNVCIVFDSPVGGFHGPGAAELSADPRQGGGGVHSGGPTQVHQVPDAPAGDR